MPHPYPVFCGTEFCTNLYICLIFSRSIYSFPLSVLHWSADYNTRTVLALCVHWLATSATGTLFSKMDRVRGIIGSYLTSYSDVSKLRCSYPMGDTIKIALSCFFIPRRLLNKCEHPDCAIFNCSICVFVRILAPSCLNIYRVSPPIVKSRVV